MIEILQHGERLLDDFMGLDALDIDNESDAASIVLETRIVQSLLLRQS